MRYNNYFTIGNLILSIFSLGALITIESILYIELSKYYHNRSNNDDIGKETTIIIFTIGILVLMTLFSLLYFIIAIMHFVSWFIYYIQLYNKNELTETTVIYHKSIIIYDDDISLDTDSIV